MPGRSPTHWILALLALSWSLTVAAPVGAQDSARDFVVDAAWLAERMGRPDLVLLHVGPEEAFAEEHIPGARYVSLGALSAPQGTEGEAGLRLQMPDPDTLAAALEALGISDESTLVVYPGTDWVSAAARVLVTLDWVGLRDRAYLLDGGIKGWKAAGHPVSDATVPVGAGRLTARVRDDLVVDAAWVRAHLEDPAVQIVDARNPEHYRGEEPTYLRGEPVRLGHIPGAANIPFPSLWNDDQTLKSPEELAAIFRAAGVEPGRTLVGYCHIGQYASGFITAARSLGYEVRLYDGSFQDWGSRSELPVNGPDGG